MLQKKEPITTAGFSKGLFTKGNILTNEPGHSPNCMDIKWNFDESIQKRLGTTTRNTVKIGSTTLATWTLNSSGTLSTSIAQWWKMNETQGDRYSQIDNTILSPVNDPKSDSGIINLAAKFISSSSQYLYKVHTTDISPGNNNFSISTWIYLDSTSASEIPIMAKMDTPSAPSTTVLIVHADTASTFTDFSLSAHGVATTAGSIKADASQFKFGGASIKFNSGTSDTMNYPDSADWNFGTGDFTIDFWTMLSSLGGGVRSFVHIGSYSSDGVYSYFYNGDIYLHINAAGVTASAPFTANTATWYHVAIMRSSSFLKMYIDGVQTGTDVANSANITGGTAGVSYGGDAITANYFDGWMDEMRIAKIACWGTNFTPPTIPYYTIPKKYEYYLYVNTDNLITFRTSSNGSSQTATVTASSIGTVNTSTWYNIIAWQETTSLLGVSVNLSANSAAATTGAFQSNAPLLVGGMSGSATQFMNGRIDETGFWNKKLSKGETQDLYGGGTGDSYTRSQSAYTWGMTDFGASSLRWLMVAAGTGMYASSNMGLTFVVATTNRTQTYNGFERSKNVLIVTNDSYDPVIYWAGSVGTYMANLAPGSAPASKFSINYQGYLILLNQLDNKRRFAYNLDSTQLTSTWPNYFDLPSSFDDEITNAFVVNRILYVSTRYRIFKLSLAGGNPDWSYVIVKEWGFVPRTVKICFLMDREWAVGMDWNRRMRAFDGYNEMFISNNVEADNGMCEFATSKVSFSGSGLAISNAVFDPIEQEYRLNVAIGMDSQDTTHTIVLNARSLALYPYSNQFFQGMCIAESSNRQFLMACDRSGYVHILNTSNTDAGIPINEYFESPFIYSKVPGMVNKGGKIDMFFKPSATGNIYFQDRADFSNDYKNSKKTINLAMDPVTHIYKSIDIPSTHNIYQYKLMSSSNTAEPWVLTHTDIYQQPMGIGRGD